MPLSTSRAGSAGWHVTVTPQLQRASSLTYVQARPGVVQVLPKTKSTLNSVGHPAGFALRFACSHWQEGGGVGDEMDASGLESDVDVSGADASSPLAGTEESLQAAPVMEKASAALKTMMRFMRRRTQGACRAPSPTPSGPETCGSEPLWACRTCRSCQPDRGRLGTGP
jgi:hypothetical protein